MDILKKMSIQVAVEKQHNDLQRKSILFLTPDVQGENFYCVRFQNLQQQNTEINPI